MNKKLTQEELLEWLKDRGEQYKSRLHSLYPEHMHKHLLETYDAVDTRIKEIVKFHFNDIPKEGHMKIADHPDIPFMKEIQQKPTVSKKKVYQFVDKEFQDRGFENSPYRPMSCEVKDMILSILKELGIKMEEK